MAIETVSVSNGSYTADVAIDVVGNTSYQVIKLMLGADGAEDLLVDSGQQTMANSIPVAIASNQTAIPITDNAGNISIDDGGNSITVDGTVTVNVAAGTNNIGDVDVLTLPSIPAGNNNIGDVDIASIAAGNNNIGDVDIASIAAGNNNIGDVDVASLIPGTGATNLGKAIDSAAGATDTGVGFLGIRDDTLSTLTPADGDWVPARFNSRGALHVTGEDLDVAHDAVDSGNPVKIGFKAESSPKGSTLVADGDRTDGYADLDGIQLVKLNTANGDLISEATSIANTTSTAFTTFSAVASTRNYITAIEVFRTDSGTTAAYVDFRDGTAGSVLWRMVLPAGGGSIIANSAPIFKTSAATALAFQASASLTTVYINVSGFQSKA